MKVAQAALLSLLTTKVANTPLLANAVKHPEDLLSKKAVALLRDLDNGKLLHAANTLTRLSGHGRLRKSNGEFIDIGGSTGGFVRTVLDDWEPPDFNDW
jgi:predicted rRNA methylase YqxC with S4 and FtsJ domains